LNEIQTKQWLIERIEHVLGAFDQGLVANKEKFEKFSDDQISEIKSKRNGILSTIGITATLLVGLVPTSIIPDSLKQTVLFWAFVVALPLGFATFLATVIITRHKSAKLWRIEKTYLEGFTAQKFIQGFVAMRTFDLDKINEYQLETLYLYLVVIESGITCNIINEYGKVYNTGSLKDQDQITTLYEIATKVGYDLHNNLLKGDKQFFTSEQLKNVFGVEAVVFLKEFNKFIDPLVARFRNEGSGN
jgi:hypothetical protein